MGWQAISTVLAQIPARRSAVAALFDASFEPLCVLSLDGLWKRVNPAFTDRLGYDQPDALPSRNFLDLIHADDRSAAAARIAGLDGGAGIAATESRFLCADGTCRRLEWRVVPLPRRRIACLAARDVTQQGAAVEALSTGMLEDLADAFFQIDRGWRITHVHRRAGRQWLRRDEELAGRPFWSVFSESGGGPLRELLERAMESGAPAHLPDFCPRPGLNLWFDVHAYPAPGGLTAVFRDVTELHQAREKLARSLEEKEVLLREVHHRVKNNLQVICSLLRLQARYLQDETLLQVLRECRERVLAMALLHDQIHRAKDISNINLGEYIRSLAASLFCSYGVNSADIDLRIGVDDITVAIDTAIPCGLLVHELVSNSLRHAFPGGRGCIWLELHALPDGRAELAIRDNGQGFPAGPPPTPRRTLGLWLVDLLAEQLGAPIERSSDAGLAYRLAFDTTN